MTFLIVTEATDGDCLCGGPQQLIQAESYEAALPKAHQWMRELPSHHRADIMVAWLVGYEFDLNGNGLEKKTWRLMDRRGGQLELVA